MADLCEKAIFINQSLDTTGSHIGHPPEHVCINCVSIAQKVVKSNWHLEM